MIPIYWWNQRRNFGDRLTPWLLEQVTGQDVVRSDNSPRLVSLGSVLAHAKTKDVVWGSGLWHRHEKIADALEIHALRGPLTYQVAVKKFPDIPEVFGDPAILLSRYYSPNVSRFPGVTVIAHLSDEWLENGDRRISVEEPPLAVVDAIASSEIIVTSSLHALIIAEVYGIPVVPLRSSQHLRREPHFKFVDYFASTDRKDYTLFDQPIREAVRNVRKIPKPKFPDREKLLAAFPWDRLETE